MRATSRLFGLCLATAAVAACTSAVAAPTPPQRCGASKLKSSAKDASAQLKCHSKAVRRGQAVDTACLLKAATRLIGGFAKAESRGGCVAAGDVAAIQAILDQLAADVVDALPFAADKSARACAASKLKVSGKRGKALLVCESKAAKRGEGVDSTCVARAGTKFAAAFAKAESKGGCTTVGDEGALGVLSDDAVAAVAGLLAPVCGDNIAGPGEPCDGSDDAVCPGKCVSSCVCAGDCGNGVVEVGEECDDGGNLSGDGCRDDCQLEDASALCAGIAAAPGTALAKELVGTFSSPLHLAAAPLDPSRLFVVEQGGTIRVVRDGVELGQPFLDISAQITSGGERGLLSMAFHPDYETNGRFFINYTDVGGDTVVSRWRVSGDPDVADSTSETIVLTVAQPFSNHNGGQVAFGPDGYLYVGMGDGGLGGDPLESAQDDTSLLGKMLRLDVDVDTPPFRAVPPSNPGAGAGDPLGLIWAKGMRNPWRFAFDRASGDLYIGDVGQDLIEEIDYQAGSSAGGENYGWDVFEGSSCFEPDPDPVCPDPPLGFTHPVHEYVRPLGCSVTGGFVYRGCAMPDLHGTYFYSDFCTPFVRTFEVVDGVAINHTDRSAELGAGLSTISSYGEDARGELYVVALAGEVWRMVPN